MPPIVQRCGRPERVVPRIYIEDQPIETVDGASVAAAMSRAGLSVTRYAVNGAPRAPACGMGVCQECRVLIDGVQRLACQTPVRPGMRIERHRVDDMSCEQ